ncbi:unnamed protein product [Haemonchus placei]|uniref:SCP domain-containing protein n=1 Tax=Haemonchus placei TaxID=6290 RepID=A0A0N4W4Z6_HAEPC|nr:unnamed protein product [Haemonchus placei]
MLIFGVQAPLAEGLNGILKTLNMHYRAIRYDTRWAKRALGYLKSSNSLNANMVIKGKQIARGEVLAEGWLFCFANTFARARFTYGCNGVINKKKGDREFGSFIIIGLLEWSYEWAEKALEYLKSPDSVKADLVIKGKQSFPADDTQLLWQKLLAFLEPRFDKKEKALERLPEGTIYGCNGFIDRKGNKDFISAACLYKKP